MSHRRRSLLVVSIATAALLAGCGGSSGGSSAPPPSPSPSVDTAAQDKAAVIRTWETFFRASSGSVDDHIALLQDGEKFRAELTASSKDPANAALLAKVTNVVVNGDTATVTYDLLGKGGAVLLGGSNGEAIKVGDAWLVSKKTYCQLITLQDSSVAHPGCSG